MKNLKIIFSSPKSSLMFFGRLIESVEKRPFSHAAIIYKDPITEVNMVFQASHGIVHDCSLDLFLTSNNIVKMYKFDVEDCIYSHFWQELIFFKGIKYSWLQILGISLKKLTHLKAQYIMGLMV